MDIRQLKYFIEIVDANCNMSKAAKRLFMSQSALSQVIVNFENNHKIALFHREKGRLVGLTPIGHLYYKYALEVTNLYDQMEATLEKEAKKLSKVVKLGLPSILLRTTLAQFIMEMRNKHPDITIEISEAGCHILSKGLDRNRIDLAFLCDPLPARDPAED